MKIFFRAGFAAFLVSLSVAGCTSSKVASKNIDSAASTAIDSLDSTAAASVDSVDSIKKQI